MWLIFFGLGLLAVIGFAMIFVGFAVMVLLAVAISLIFYFVLVTLLGDQNAGLSLVLAIALGLVGAVMILNRGDTK